MRRKSIFIRKLLIGVLVVVPLICNAQEEYFYVYPNPVEEAAVSFYFEYRNIVERVEISLYDLNCRLIKMRSFTVGDFAGALNLSIEDLKGGLYIWHAEVLLKPGIKKEYVKLLGVIR